LAALVVLRLNPVADQGRLVGVLRPSMGERRREPGGGGEAGQHQRSKRNARHRLSPVFRKGRSFAQRRRASMRARFPSVKPVRTDNDAYAESFLGVRRAKRTRRRGR
jgi:hypothetical protein